MQKNSAISEKADLCPALWRLLDERAEFVIGDPTEIVRPQACKTEYVGTLTDRRERNGRTRISL